MINDSPIIAFFSAACLFCCAALVFAAVPQWIAYNERLAHIKYYDRYISSSDEFDMIRQKLESKNKLLASKLSGITAETPPRTISDILQELIRHSKERGVMLAKIQPQSEPAPANAGYVPVLLETKTGYNKLRGYVASLEALPQILQIRKIAIEAAGDGELNVKLLVFCLAAAEGGD